MKQIRHIWTIRNLKQVSCKEEKKNEEAEKKKGKVRSEKRHMSPSFSVIQKLQVVHYTTMPFIG